MDRQRLLIIEDQEAIASQLRWALGEEYEVSVAGTGKAAVDLADSYAPDLVTLDLGIPPDPLEPASEPLVSDVVHARSHDESERPVARG